MRIHTSHELREIDRHAAETLGIPTLVLMENAGRAVADVVRESMRERRGRVVVVCGKGNNGGDGFVVARQLQVTGVSTVVVALAGIDELKGDALANAKAAQACGLEWRGSLEGAGAGDVVVDAIFGTGLSRAPEGRALELIRAINVSRERGALVVAVDVPSGVDADRPQIMGETVVADITVTLHALKTALVQHPARQRCGDVRVASLGIPSNDGPGPERTFVTRDFARSLFIRRDADAHKGTSGHVLVVAGSVGKSGAALLACRGALRGGAGLVTLASSPMVLDRALPELPEIMAFPLELNVAGLTNALDKKDVLVLGPGIARDATTAATIVDVLSKIALPAVLDADGLNALAGDPTSLSRLSSAKLPPILTPHPAELARLLATDTKDVQSDRFAAATEAAKRFHAFVVLKGAGTVVAEPNGSVWVNPSGTPAMATGGTGDVLAGVIGALVAQGMSPRSAAILGVFVHGRAGELASHHRDRGMLASELADHLPQALAELA